MAEKTNIKVVVRVRPYNRRELEQNQRTIIKVLDKTTLLFDPEEEYDEFFFQGSKLNYRDITKRVNKKLSMEYDRVFDTDASNMSIFEECTAPLIDSLLDGYNCSVFVYGATGAGKTFTMLGNESCAGLTFLTMRDLFEKIEAQTGLRKFEVGVSYLEVYNEQVMNLLTKSGPLKLREDSNGVVVSGLILKPIYSAEELLDLLTLGNSHRTQHPTDANAESSRSHAVFQVHIRITERKTGTKRMVKLSMIDLAGSERAASTKGIGVRFKEGASINKSLLALGNCINRLADGSKHIPYRDSNLTRILKDSLGGSCRTLMVANISMSSLTYEDTYNTLKYASRAKTIRTTLRQNALRTNMPKEFYVKKVNELMDENERLKQTNADLELKASKATTFDETELRPWYNRIDQIYSSIVKSQEKYIGLKSRVKILTFRISLKTEMENSRKILYGDCESQENISSYTSSVCFLSNQIEKLSKEVSCWRQKLRATYNDLNKIKAEINSSKYANFLQIYLKYKNLEIQNSKKSVLNKHMQSIHSELVSNSIWKQKALTIASQVIKNGSLNTQQRYHYEQLELHLGNAAHQDELNICENLVNGQHPISSDEDNDQFSTDSTDMHNNKTHGKRLRLEECELDDLDDILDELCTDEENPNSGTDTLNGFKVPMKRLCKLNETKVLSELESNANTTFYVGSSTSSTNCNVKLNNKTAAAKSNIISNITSDQLVKTTANPDQLKNVLLKSKKFTHGSLLKTVAAGIQKENKKYSPNRIRKSPRAAVLNAAAASIVKQRQAIRHAMGGTELPAVRLNRATSLRVKK